MNTIMKRNQDLFGGLMDSLLNDSPLFSTEVSRHYSIPAVNIKNTDERYEIDVAAPGLKKEDFNIELDDNILKLSVNKSQESEEKEGGYSRKEFSFLNFQRSFTLPKNGIDATKIEANYNDGILNIVLPKQKEEKESVRKINVQ